MIAGIGITDVIVAFWWVMVGALFGALAMAVAAANKYEPGNSAWLAEQLDKTERDLHEALRANRALRDGGDRLISDLRAATPRMNRPERNIVEFVAERLTVARIPETREPVRPDVPPDAQWYAEEGPA